MTSDIDVAGAKAFKRKEARKGSGMAFLGSTLEYYDFFIYGTAAALAFGKVMFNGGTAATVAALATFGVSYVARPLGGVIFGHLGDRRGRRWTFMATLMLMGACTFLIGCLPTYDQVGWLAPALLVVLRIGQGFSAGGESAGGSTMTMELAPPGTRGFHASWTICGANAGIVLASLIFLPIATLNEQALLSWGWRIPFLVSAFVTLGAYFAGRTIKEPPVLKAALTEDAAEKKKERLPFIEVFRTHPGGVIRVALGILFAVTNTVVTVFALSYAKTELGIKSDLMLVIMIVVNIIGIGTQVFWARLSDKVGRKPIFVTGALGCAVFIFVYFEALQTKNGWLIFLASVVLTGVFYAMPNGVYPAMFTEQFDAKIRYTGTALGLQVGLLIAGFTPSISAALVNGDAHQWPRVAIFTAVACVLAAGATLAGKETAHTSLEELGKK
jgi:MFS family permease